MGLLKDWPRAIPTRLGLGLLAGRICRAIDGAVRIGRGQSLPIIAITIAAAIAIAIAITIGITIGTAATITITASIAIALGIAITTTSAVVIAITIAATASRNRRHRHPHCMIAIRCCQAHTHPPHILYTPAMFCHAGESPIFALSIFLRPVCYEIPA